MSTSQTSNVLTKDECKSTEETLDANVAEVDGHVVNDQSTQSQLSHQEVIEGKLRTFQKFNGNGDAEQWLMYLLDKFDSLGVNMAERIIWIPNVLSNEAFIWYARSANVMPTFIAFTNLFLQRFSTKRNEEIKITTNNNNVQMSNLNQDDVFGSLRSQLLLSHIEKLPKFTGRSKQNVSKWLREENQAMHLLKLSDTEKLFYIPSCLDADAKDWFFDNYHFVPSWSLFVQKLLDTFESSSKADIAFNRSRQYQQSLHQDVRQYYFELMKLCKEANPLMDESSKLQYLKDGLKSSLRFDILLKNPTTTEEFLKYAQKIEELRSLDEQQGMMEQSSQQQPNLITTSARSSNSPANYARTSQTNNKTTITRHNLSNQHRQNNRTPKPPYRCYRCDGSSIDGDAPTRLLNPSPIFILAKVNQVITKIMFDTGSAKSFIKKSILEQTNHVNIQFKQQSYLMADGSSTFNILGTTEIFIEFEKSCTSIIAGVVDTLCVDCLLGMDYINKYYVNLNNKEKQVQIHIQDIIVDLPMENTMKTINVPGRANAFTYF
ncbi:unnamed protein product, partial [Rotaria socialis]